MMRYSDAGENSAEVRMKSRDSREIATTVGLDRKIVCVMIDRGNGRMSRWNGGTGVWEYRYFAL